VNKVSAVTALNIGQPAAFTIDVQNVGGSYALRITFLDLLPDTVDVGLCAFDPTAGLSAHIFAADCITPVSGVLNQGVDYSVSYTGSPTCELELTMLTSAAVIGSTERLIITYQNELDADTTPAGDGVVLSNIAGATQWFSGDPAGVNPVTTFNNVLTDGSPGVTDFQDSHDITAILSGYLYQKIAVNVTSGESPATTAAPGDTLRYRLRLFNFDEIINDVSFSDTLDPALFDTSTFTMLTALPAGNVDFSFDTVTGLLQIFGETPPLNLTPPQELIIEV